MLSDNTNSEFWFSCARFGQDICLLDGDDSVSYADLIRLADAWVQNAREVLSAGIVRPLVGMEIAPTVGLIAAYLGCLRAGWPIILLPTGQVASNSPNSIVGVYQPNLLVLPDPSSSEGTQILSCASEPCEMPDDLAVLLSTSGTTGAVKLVMLSAENIDANAKAISDYLAIQAEDVAITSLALHYSYGMSVLNSYLCSGATLALTSDGLVEPEFWELARHTGTTSLALVPAQFEILESVGFCKSDLPTLRYITQAGGRLDPRLGDKFSEMGLLDGWDLVIMYGQTEAAPRISYVPPMDLPDCAHTIGRPIPGGMLWIEDSMGRRITETETAGELVYQGTNVMIGYATTRGDIAQPARPTFLRTGDIAERLENGYFRIVGRASRFVKLFGLRVGLDEIEAALRAEGHSAYVSGDDSGIVVFLQHHEPNQTTALGDQLAEKMRLPASVIVVSPLAEVPLLSSGKADYRTLGERAKDVLANQSVNAPKGDLKPELARILRCKDLDSALSFREHGGDSLAYLEAELLLSASLRNLPDNWENIPIGDLLVLQQNDETSAAKKKRLAIRPDLLMRIAAIATVVLLHATDYPVGGGVYILTILAGLSFARFQMTPLLDLRIGKVLATMLLPILLAYYATLAVLSTNFIIEYRWIILTANFYAAGDSITTSRFLLPYWFVSAYAQVIVLFSLMFLLGSVRRTIAKHPFLFGVGLLLFLSIVLGLSPAGELSFRTQIRYTLGTLQLFTIGWCIATANGPIQKAIASTMVVLSYLILWRDADPSVMLFLTAAPILVIWSPRISLPKPISQALLILGTLTLYIYIAHVPVLLVAQHFIKHPVLLFCATMPISVGAAMVMRGLFGRVLDKIYNGLNMRGA